MLPDIINRGRKLGYGAHIKENEKETLDYREQEIKKQTRKFIISAILSFAIIMDDGWHIFHLHPLFICQIY